ncbi:hypothetical protein ACKWTF_015329 [Chironomus riparius]
MEITCRAKSTIWHPGFRKMYSCNIIRSDLRPIEAEPLRFTITHEEKGKTDKDVEAVVILDSKIYKIPKNFEQFFKNIQVLCIKQCNLETLERKDLQNFSCLKEVWMPNNKLKLLPDNLFIDHPEIQKLSFSNNQLSVIGERILEPIEDLRYANFNKNLTIDMTFNADDDKVLLDDLKEVIRSNCKGVNRSVFKQKKRNFDYIRNSLDAHQHLSVSTEVMTSSSGSSIQNASLTRTESYRMVFRKHHFFTSPGTSSNSEISFQRVHNVVQRRNYQETPKGRPKARSMNQKTQTEEKTTFSDDLNALMMRDSFKDFSIKNQSKTYNVHRFVMAARSPVVCEMIKKNPSLRGINLQNAHDNIIEHLLEYIYDDHLPDFDEFGDFMRIYDLSVKLQLADLVVFAKQNILAKVTPDNAIECLEMGLKNKDTDLRIKGLEIIQNIFPQKRFKDSLLDDFEALGKMIKEWKAMKKTIDDATLKFNQLSFFESKNAIEKY